MQTDILDTLFTARDVVSDIIIAQTPANPAHKKLLEKLMQRRDQLTGAIQQVINAEFAKTGTQLTQAIASLESSTAQLKDVANTIDNVSSVISIIDQIVQLVGEVVALAA
jgi:ABC-type transporter Mla subunit MlaD